MKYTKVTFICSYVVWILLFGCSKDLDYLYSFQLTGTIYDSTTRESVSGININFKDTGLDYIRSEDEGHLLVIGKSDSGGFFNCSFEYWWGYKDTFFSRPPSKTFDLIFEKEGYETKIISLDVDRIDRIQKTYFANIGKVRMRMVQEDQ